MHTSTRQLRVPPCKSLWEAHARDATSNQQDERAELLACDLEWWWNGAASVNSASPTSTAAKAAVAVDDADNQSIVDDDGVSLSTGSEHSLWHKPESSSSSAHWHSSASESSETRHWLDDNNSKGNGNLEMLHARDDNERMSDVSSLLSSAASKRSAQALSLQASSAGDHNTVDGGGVFASGVSMMALWLGADSVSTSSNHKSDSSSSSSSSESMSTPDNFSLGIASSASLRDGDNDNRDELASSLSDSSCVSSLSALSAQSGVCKLSSPRLIENIPVLRAPMDDDASTSLRWLHEDTESATYMPPVCWSYRAAFVHAADLAFAPLAEANGNAASPHHRHRHTTHRESRAQQYIKLQRRLLAPAARLDDSSNSSKDTSHLTPSPAPPDPHDALDLFVKFSDVCGILFEHAPRRHGLFLDLGCGTSSVCRDMVLHGYSRVIGVDVAPSKLAWQRAQCGDDLRPFVQFYEMGATALCFPDGLLDCVFTKALLDMAASSYVYAPRLDDTCDELQRMLHEIARCVAPGGVWIVVSCYGSHTSDSVLPYDGTNQDEDSDATELQERYTTPWWHWRGIAETIQTHFDCVQTYGAGVPELRRGKRVTPFSVRVYRRKESLRQRFTRRLRDQEEEQCSWRLAAIAAAWQAEKRRSRVEFDARVLETQQMIAEDAVAQCVERNERRAAARAARDALRTVLLCKEAERKRMALEDTAAAALRTELRERLAFVKDVMLDIAMAAVAVAEATREALARARDAANGTSLPEQAESAPHAEAIVATSVTEQTTVKSSGAVVSQSADAAASASLSEQQLESAIVDDGVNAQEPQADNHSVQLADTVCESVERCADAASLSSPALEAVSVATLETEPGDQPVAAPVASESDAESAVAECVRDVVAATAELAVAAVSDGAVSCSEQATAARDACPSGPNTSCRTSGEATEATELGRERTHSALQHHATPDDVSCKTVEDGRAMDGAAIFGQFESIVGGDGGGDGASPTALNAADELDQAHEASRDIVVAAAASRDEEKDEEHVSLAEDADSALDPGSGPGLDPRPSDAAVAHDACSELDSLASTTLQEDHLAHETPTHSQSRNSSIVVSSSDIFSVSDNEDARTSAVCSAVLARIIEQLTSGEVASRDGTS